MKTAFSITILLAALVLPSIYAPAEASQCNAAENLGYTYKKAKAPGAIQVRFTFQCKFKIVRT